MLTSWALSRSLAHHPVVLLASGTWLGRDGVVGRRYREAMITLEVSEQASFRVLTFISARRGEKFIRLEVFWKKKFKHIDNTSSS